MSSCEDMLEVDSDRVEYDMSPLTLNDTVYSVLGILKNVQAVADRQVLFGELRGDLMVVNEGSAVTDIQKIARFDYSGDNKYLDAKDYFAIINNCNIYLARVDTTLTRDNKKLMLREYVAVKSTRAWAYLQLAANFGKIPFFTEPILTHSLSQEVYARERLDIEQVAEKLIEDLRPYADPIQYPMPQFSGLKPSTDLHFVPIRQLLGDLYLWKKDYRNAVDCYYNLILEKKYAVNGIDMAGWASEEGGTMPMGTYAPLMSFNKNNTTAMVSFSSSSEKGTVSELPSLLVGDPLVVGSHQVAAAPGYYGLSKRQTYYFAKPNSDNKADSAITTTNPSDDLPGDVRLYKIVEDNVHNNETGMKYNGVITKYGEYLYSLGALKLGRPVQVYLRLAEALAGLATEPANSITIGGNTVAESSWESAADIAMYILRYGLGTRKIDVKSGEYKGLVLPAGISSGKYEIKKRLSDEMYEVQVVKTEIDPATGDEVVVYKKTVNPETGVEEPVYITDEEGNIQYDPVTNEPLQMPDSVWEPRYREVYDAFTLDFTNEAFNFNLGIHRLGSGFSEWDNSLSLDNDYAIATYMGLPKAENPDTIYEYDENGDKVVDANGNFVITDVDYGVTPEIKIAYLRNLILDECALETSLEGYRFTDLIRFARAMDDKNILAKRVASRAYENRVNMYYDNTKEVYGEDGVRLEFKWDETLREKLAGADSDKYWYLPLQ